MPSVQRALARDGASALFPPPASVLLSLLGIARLQGDHPMRLDAKQEEQSMQLASYRQRHREGRENQVGARNWWEHVAE